jgi:hypothetical protein
VSFLYAFVSTCDGGTERRPICSGEEKDEEFGDIHFEYIGELKLGMVSWSF